ncbi:MAG: CPBP family intramembrane metalloprotease [Eubacteriales bacterium]|nr:CPBP family intramembrane metalloprotease [Eubacteriales bacterium]
MEPMSKKEANSIIMYILSTLVMYLVTMKIMGLFMEHIPRYLCTRTIETISIFLLIFFLEYTDLQIYTTGLVGTKEEIKRTLIRCSLICIGIIIAFVIVRLIMESHNPKIANRAWFKPYFHLYMRWYYPFVSILQEILSKSIMQESLKRLFGEEEAKLSLIACCFIFALFHVNYQLYYIIGAGLLNYVTGRIYEKDHTIWGCSMIHFCVGFLPRAMGLK